MSENETCKEVVTEARKNQMEYWLNMSVTKDIKPDVSNFK